MSNTAVYWGLALQTFVLHMTVAFYHHRLAQLLECAP